MVQHKHSNYKAPANAANTAPKTKADRLAGWDDADEVVIPALAVVEKMEDGDAIVGVYMGAREVPTRFDRPCTLHYFMTDDGLIAVWGSMAIASGMACAIVGRETRIDPIGWKDLDAGKRLRIVRIRQRGPVARVPALGPKAGYPALPEQTITHLGRDGVSREINTATGEVMPANVF
jgi:hypothetical protein